MKSADVFDTLGDVALALLALPLIAVFLLVLLALLAVNHAHDKRWLGPFAAGLLLAYATVHLVGCASPATPARDPRDPEIWRPSAPARYPLPR